ncbi:hypothetical protein DPEC_G00316180, partial [Dallia pectoralis]
RARRILTGATSPLTNHNHGALHAGRTAARRTEQATVLSSAASQMMDSLVQPLVAQYLAMGCQSKENGPHDNAGSNGKDKEHPRLSPGPGFGCRSKISPPVPARPQRFNRPNLAPMTQGKVIVSTGQFTKGATWEELIQACIQTFDTEGCVCGSNHVMNTTLTMHRLLMSSSDLLEKLASLYPLPSRPDALRVLQYSQNCDLNGIWPGPFGSAKHITGSFNGGVL